jgi:hypothetical protein
MAYGDITHSPNQYRAPGKPGVQTVRRAVLLKDSGSTIGSAGVNYLSDTKTLEQLGASEPGGATASTSVTKAILHNNAGIYVGTAGNIMVGFAGQKDVIESGTATGTAVTNKLVDTSQNFTETVQLRDFVINTTDGTVAFVSAIDSDTVLSLVNVSNTTSGPSSDIMAEGEKYEIHRPIVFQNVAAGSFLPIEVNRVFSTGTTADDIMAIY